MNMYTKDSLPNKKAFAANPELDRNENQWCFSYYAGSEKAGTSEKAALLLETQWNPGDQISISFLDGDEEIQNRVINAAIEWVSTGLANLTFEFRKDTTETDIRISFRYAGSWSVLGTTCKNVDIDEPTMNFGWLDEDTSDDDLRRVVLHEFGHALGLIHEHMNPANGGINWNKEQVEKDLSGPPNNWSPEIIFNNMFKTFEEDELQTSHLDRNSIMMYPIPSTWTTDGFNVGLNTELSDVDKRFIQEIYPGNNL
jgi:serralysin